MPPPADPANPIEEQENAQDDVEEHEQEEEQEPPAKRAKGMREWTAALLAIFCHVCTCTTCQGAQSAACDHEHSLNNTMPGKQNKERRQSVKKDVHNAKYKTEQGTLFHKGKLDKNYKEVGAIGCVNYLKKWVPLHAPPGDAAQRHRQDMRHDFYARFYCPGANVTLLCKEVVEECTSCQENEREAQAHKPMKSIRALVRQERYQIDLADIGKGKEALMRGHNCRYVLTSVDSFSKRAKVWKLKNKEAKKIARCLKRYFKEEGTPRILQSDNGKEFNNHMLDALIQELRIKAVHGAPLKPQTQGQIERFNRTFKTDLERAINVHARNGGDRADWPDMIDELVRKYNATVHASTGFPPNALWYGSVNYVEDIATSRWVPLDAAYLAEYTTQEGVFNAPDLDAGLYFGDVHLNPEGLDDDDADRLNRYIQTYAEDPFEADSDAIREAIASLSDERREQYLTALEKSTKSAQKAVVKYNSKRPLQEFELGTRVAVDRPSDPSKRFGTIRFHENRRVVGAVTARKLMFQMYLVQYRPDEDSDATKQMWLFGGELRQIGEAQGNIPDQATAEGEITVGGYQQYVQQVRSTILTKVMQKDLDMDATELTEAATAAQQKIMTELKITGVGTEFINAADECHELGVQLWQHALDLTLIDCLQSTNTNQSTITSLFWWLMKENKFKFACAATELWAREVRHLSNDSVVARALRGSDHDDCLKCLASGCAHVCCRAAWDKLGLKNGFLRLDGEEQLVLTDVAKEVESDPEVEISDVDEEELHLSEPEDPQVTQEELRHELDDLEETTGPVQEQFSAPQMFLVESSSGNICIDQGTGCDEFLNKFDFQQENEFMLADPELQFFVHYQAQDRIPNLEMVDVKHPVGQGTWDAGRDTGACSGLFCFHSSHTAGSEC